MINHDGLHRYLWRRTDDRNRIMFQIGEVAAKVGCCYRLINDNLLAMREQGRLRVVDCKCGKRYVYEVADPETWDPQDPETWARPRRTPVWG